MKESRDYLSLDLTALQYLEAVKAGDLEIVAALWDEASLDRRLEKLLVELDGELFAEEAAGHLAVNQSPLPSNIRPQRPWVVRLGVPSLVAAACLLVLLATINRHDRDVVPRPPHAVLPPSSQLVRQRFDFVLLKARRDLDFSEMPRFNWPATTETSLRSSALMRPELLD